MGHGKAIFLGYRNLFPAQGISHHKGDMQARQDTAHAPPNGDPWQVSTVFVCLQNFKQDTKVPLLDPVHDGCKMDDQ